MNRSILLIILLLGCLLSGCVTTQPTSINGGLSTWPGGIAWWWAFNTLASIAVALIVLVLFKNRRDARSLALASFIAAIIGAIVVLFWPIYESGMRISSAGTQVIPPHLVWFGLLRSEGSRFLIFLEVPIVITGLGVLAFRIKHLLLRITTVWAIAIIWLLADLAAMFTIGFFYFPSAILMVFAAFKASIQKIDPSPA
ncbi:MAG: hypothetical protein TUN42_08365 [Dehalogenimonas sp.]